MKNKVLLILIPVVVLSFNIIAFGNINENLEEINNIDMVLNADSSYSKWAEESIISAINAGIVPESIQKEYTDKITRKEFCQLAIQTYLIKTGTEINKDSDTPFIDINDIYVTAAYNMKIVSGTGNDKFSPDNNITRQEAAVMLNNLATLLNVDNGNSTTEKFVDEDYFADWAKSAIYSVAGIKSGDIYLMMGTGDNKFSPWMNYTREQAIVTMYRLYNCKERALFYDGQYMQSTDEAEEIYGDWLYYNNKEFINDKTYSTIVRLKKDGSERQVIACNEFGVFYKAIVGEYIYYTEMDKNSALYNYKMKLDGSGIEEVSMEEFESIPIKNPYNEKYIFYEEEGFIAKSNYNYLTRCNLDKSDSKRLIGDPIFDNPILYGDFVYTIMLTQLESGSVITYDIVRIDSDGNIENITNNNGESLRVSKIIKIDNGKIYYKRRTYLLYDSPRDSDLVYSINIDGSDDKLIY